MKNYIKEFKTTGECPINLESVISQWNNRCSISVWAGENTLSEDKWVAGKRMGRSKIKISTEDAANLVYRLNLRNEQGALRSGSVWRTAPSEKDYVISEVTGYFQANPTKRPTKFVQNVINKLGIKI